MKAYPSSSRQCRGPFHGEAVPGFLKSKQGVKLTEKQKKIRKAPPKAWKPGQSGNPAGRPVDPARKDAMELLKCHAPAIVQKALDLVLCDDPDIAVLNGLIKKIFPDNLNLSGGENPLRIFLERYSARPEI
jgi:hypothetical protein